ncbi:MAG: carboxypeptidase regulatory-like domain-containing protein [Clostridia bacterium]|nr:carboxypeptidase regulatory-like domain-containing protein [Clostridia bacterium]
MDYRDNFQDMIARYNRELMRAYQQGQQEPPPAAEEDTRPRYPLYEDTEPATEAVAEAVPPAPQPAPPPPAFSPAPPLEVGYLQVWVTTASSALPVEGAHVTVSRDEEGESLRAAQYIGTTDSSGRTEIIPLPAASSQLSLAPGGNPTPYTPYNVEVHADGYYRVENVNIPMYGGVRAIQPVRLIPLPEYGEDSDLLIYPESGPTNLDGEEAAQ